MTSDIPITTMDMETSTPAHTPGEPTKTTDVAVAQTTVTHDEYGDAGDDATPDKDDAVAITSVEEDVYVNATSNLAYKELRTSFNTADGKACSFANCGYVSTIKVPDDDEYKSQLLHLPII